MPTTPRILISSNHDALAASLAQYAATATVEAEYGDRVVAGSIATLAHHGARSSEPCPCSDEAHQRLRPHRAPSFAGDRTSPLGPVGISLVTACESCGPGNAQATCDYCRAEWRPVEAIGLSHLDLDALGGVASLLGRRQGARLWALAEAVDLRGPHRLAEAVDALAAREERAAIARDEQEVAEAGGACRMWDAAHYRVWGRRVAEEAARSLRAWWAWSRDHRVMAPRDGAVADITEQVEEAMRVVALLGRSEWDNAALVEAEPLLAAGDRFAAEEAALERASFVEADEYVVVRRSDRFVNHLYGGGPAHGCAAINTATGAVTLSLADTLSGVSCSAIARSLWGPEAGGHPGIAGSPRGRTMTEADLSAAAGALREAIRSHFEQLERTARRRLYFLGLPTDALLERWDEAIEEGRVEDVLRAEVCRRAIEGVPECLEVVESLPGGLAMARECALEARS